MTADVPSFVAPDLRTYALAAGDVAALPRVVAELLVKRDMATFEGGE